MRLSTVDDAPPASHNTLARRCEVGTSVATGTGIAPRERKARNVLLVGAHTVQVVNTVGTRANLTSAVPRASLCNPTAGVVPLLNVRPRPPARPLPDENNLPATWLFSHSTNKEHFHGHKA